MRTTYHTNFSHESSWALIIPGIFVLAAGAMIIGAIYMAANSFKLQQSGVSTMGAVYDVTSRVTKDSDGRRKTEYTSHLNYFDNYGTQRKTTLGGSRNIGSNVKLIFDPEDPGLVKENSFSGLWLFPIVLCVFTAVFGGIGGYLLISTLKRRQEISFLKQNGRKILAQITGINTTRSRVSNNGHGRTSFRYELLCRAVDPGPGVAATYTSEPMSDYPGEHLVGTGIYVLIDPANPSVYYVDVNSAGQSLDRESMGNQFSSSQSVASQGPAHSQPEILIPGAGLFDDIDS